MGGWTVFLALLGLAAANFEGEVSSTANTFWDKIGKSRDEETGVDYVWTEEMNEFFRRYETDPDNITLEVSESEFLYSQNNWLSDIGVTEEAGKAYFRLLDVYLFELTARITEIDTEDMVFYCDGLIANKSSDFQVEEDEFKAGFNDILRPLPWAVMFLRYFSVNDTGDYDEYMTAEDFDNIFTAIDTDADGLVVSSEVSAFYTGNGYGSASTAGKWFKIMDYYEAGNLTISNWQEVYNSLDVGGFIRPGVEFRELCQFDCLLQNFVPDSGIRAEWDLCGLDPPAPAF